MILNPGQQGGRPQNSVDEIIRQLLGVKDEIAQPPPLGAGGIAAMVLSGLGDAFSAGAGRPARAMDRVLGQRQLATERTQRGLDKQTESKRRALEIKAGRAQDKERMALDEQRYQDDLARAKEAQIRADEKADEDYRRGLLDQAVSNPFFASDPAGMTNDEIRMALRDANRQRYEKEYGKAGSAERDAAERQGFTEAAGALDAFIEGNQSLGLLPLRDRLKAGEDPAGIMASFKRKLMQFQLSPQDELMLASMLKQELMAAKQTTDGGGRDTAASKAGSALSSGASTAFEQGINLPIPGMPDFSSGRTILDFLSGLMGGGK